MKRTSKSMTEAQIDAVFEKYDRNKDGRLDFEEFKALMESNSKSYKESKKKENDSENGGSSSKTTEAAEKTTEAQEAEEDQG